MYTVEDIKKLIQKVDSAISKKAEIIGELDGKSGDGDLGISMQAAFRAMNTACQEYQEKDIGRMLQGIAKACNKAAPSTMGTLIAGGILGIAKTQIGNESLEDADIQVFPRIFAEAIMARGKAKLGDKTILDALIPMCDVVEDTYTKSKDLKLSFQKGAEAAEKAADATKGMQAKIGRAKWLGERAAEYPDAGAVLCSILVKALIE